MLKNKIGLIVILVFAILVSACGVSPNKGNEPVIPPDSQEPSSDNLVRGEVYINEAQLLILESYPVQIMMNVKGDLATPCEMLRVEVASPNDKNEIHVEMYSEVDFKVSCIAQLEPFEENVSIPMAGAADGDYTVWLNGDKVGEFGYPGG
jgi:hypothetical protein